MCIVVFGIELSFGHVYIFTGTLSLDLYYDFIFEINDYLEKHSKKRIEILKKEGHKITIKDVEEI